MSDLTDLSMTESADAFARGDVTSGAAGARSPAWTRRNAKVNAVIRLDREAALAAAARRTRHAPRAPGPAGCTACR